MEPKITGYRQLSEQEVDLMNEAQALAEQCGAFVAKLRACSPGTRVADFRADPLPQCDQRWVSIGATDLQTGFMALVRSIAKPTSF